jgi:glycosyltransferase involved in cell wall biosynthesis
MRGGRLPFDALPQPFSMRLLSLCHHRLPSPHTNTQQLVWTSTELARLGHEVEVVCCKSDAGGVAWRERIAEHYGLEALPDSIAFVPICSGRPSGILHEARADLRNVNYARRNRPAIVHTRDPFALTIALALGLRCVFETYRIDINEDARYAPWRALNYHHENLLGIVTHSDLCRRSFIHAGIPEGHVITNYNGYAPAHFTPALTREEARARLGLESMDRIATYTGRIGTTKGIPFLARVAHQLPNVTFLLVGAITGSEQERTVLRLVQELGAENIRLKPRVPPSEVSAYLFASDCLVIPPTAAPLLRHGRTVLPMKTFSYLAAGRPIVAPDLPDLREVLHHNENALLVPPDDVDAAAAAIQLAVFNQTLSEKLGNAARRDAAQFTWQERAQRFSLFLNNLGVPA